MHIQENSDQKFFLTYKKYYLLSRLLHDLLCCSKCISFAQSAQASALALMMTTFLFTQILQSS